MTKRVITKGDYFLLPYAGKRVDLLVQAVAKIETSGHWRIRYANDGRATGSVLLSSCRRCSPSVAARILAGQVGQGEGS